MRCAFPLENVFYACISSKVMVKVGSRFSINQSSSGQFIAESDLAVVAFAERNSVLPHFSSSTHLI